MPQRRAQYIVTFNSSPHYRVLIMETRIAAHGLNVTSASRIFFLNVCWQKTTERQAIKRAHRIGQTREVFVERLVVRDTIEVCLFPECVQWLICRRSCCVVGRRWVRRKVRGLKELLMTASYVGLSLVRNLW